VKSVRALGEIVVPPLPPRLALAGSGDRSEALNPPSIPCKLLTQKVLSEKKCWSAGLPVWSEWAREYAAKLDRRLAHRGEVDGR
jgi:hypothetical protein